jgi:hypothetical protein
LERRRRLYLVDGRAARAAMLEEAAQPAAQMRLVQWRFQQWAAVLEPGGSSGSGAAGGNFRFKRWWFGSFGR